MSSPTADTRAERLLLSVLCASVALWTGAAAFFSAGVLPVLFTSLETAEAGRIAALLFPPYFRAGLVVGVLATGSALILARGSAPRGKGVVLLLAAMTVSQAWSTLVVHPEMASIRGIDSEVVRFQELHRLSVRLNAVVLGGGLLLLAGSGFLLRRRDDAL